MLHVWQGGPGNTAAASDVAGNSVELRQSPADFNQVCLATHNFAPCIQLLLWSNYTEKPAEQAHHGMLF